ncbi:GMP synthase [glutamine-hydrolyzing] [Pleomorphomonas sp. SM30]|uniref:GMP synthase (Glutamine-hydrolysing) n=2 Tax=Oharaeibacter diazotrophicus TaxID=1920512 RepID=A0A4R6R6Y6_9HYPH|nr:GMP synthase (glutamine-hydrolysing) [Oharaeibacter diazotrophicus]BBE73703.1 GMP synthase [glutamine-hydrolyzing] [Pleomorphomonas sp. SM30]GLS75492.1 glutamine amidotransferase [Oharaeibacter diazotrophicus]
MTADGAPPDVRTTAGHAVPARHVVTPSSVPMALRPKILVVLHQEGSSPGRLGDMLVRRGFALDIRRPVLGDPLPASLSEHAGAIVFGGPMSANDPDAFVRTEIDWIAVPLAEEKPFLGICLGAQMLVKQLGGTVEPHGGGMAEIGYYPLEPTEAGLSVVPDWPTMVYQWHREGFDIPAGAELLAAGETFRNQAIRVGRNAYGIQFHTELTYAMLNRWTTRGAARLSLPGAQPRHAHFQGRGQFDAMTRRWLDGFLDVWIGGAAA